ncbi:Lateral organ boundaries, LOB, partial [Dillenia turbinata]
MAESQRGDAVPNGQRKGTGKRATTTPHVSVAADAMANATSSSSSAPCGACKFLRRKCVNACIFAPHFGSDQGAARFVAVLSHIPVNRRQDALVTVSYGAQARLSDPVHGCVSTVLALQLQVASLQVKLAMVQMQLINSRVAVANALQISQQQHQQQPQQLQHIALLQPVYSNSNSSACDNLVNINSFTTNFDIPTETAPSSHSLDLEPFQLPGHRMKMKMMKKRVEIWFPLPTLCFKEDKIHHTITKAKQRH